MKLIDGKLIAKDIKAEVATEVCSIRAAGKRAPGLLTILVGDDPASAVYVRSKHKACRKAGIVSVEEKLSADTDRDTLLSLIDKYNADSDIDGILVQLPLPAHLDEQEVIERINPEKDVDGFHPINVGKTLIGLEDSFAPATPSGIRELLFRSGVKTSGANLVILGRSNIVGKPMASLMIQKTAGANSTVTVCHSRSRDLESICAGADILIAAIGAAGFVKKDMVKDGAVVIDVGINRVEDAAAKKGYRIVGDVDFENVAAKCEAITPVPGGVGPMTIAVLLQNTLRSARKRLF
jgi:methylenetetrahydrofolate dehydrogenase (NADP+) / methenyltetrahydrofolate cyclohydrolase